MAQIVLDASLPDASDGLGVMEDAEFDEVHALTRLMSLSQQQL